mgnify:CR=1 FL=1
MIHAQRIQPTFSFFCSRRVVDVTLEDTVSLELYCISQSNMGGKNRIKHHMWQAITLFQGRSAMHLACERLYNASPRIVADIGGLIAIRRNTPAELLANATKCMQIHN